MICDVDGHAVLTGIVSWGIKCGVEGYPGVYGEVWHYKEWIQNKISSLVTTTAKTTTATTTTTTASTTAITNSTTTTTTSTTTTTTTTTTITTTITSSTTTTTTAAGIKYGALDVSRYFNTRYWYQVMGGNVQNYDYFHFNAPNFSNDIHIGFSNGFNGHNDAKWEIVLGGWSGKKHVIRARNQGPNLAQKSNSNRLVVSNNKVVKRF